MIFDLIPKATFLRELSKFFAKITGIIRIGMPHHYPNVVGIHSHSRTSRFERLGDGLSHRYQGMELFRLIFSQIQIVRGHTFAAWHHSGHKPSLILSFFFPPLSVQALLVLSGAELGRQATLP